MVRKLDKEKNYLNINVDSIEQDINDEKFKKAIDYGESTEYYDPDADNPELYEDLALALLNGNQLPNNKYKFKVEFEPVYIKHIRHQRYVDNIENIKDIKKIKHIRFDIFDDKNDLVKTFYLTTDYIGASKNKAQFAEGKDKYIDSDLARLSLDEIVAFLNETRKLGGHIFLPTLIQFPGNDKCEKRNVHTLNQAKGFNLNDRFDLYLLDLNNYYINGKTSESMQPVFDYFSSWLDLFDDFKGYVDFFKLNDFVSDDYTQVINLLTGEYFDKGTKVTPEINVLPKDHDGYLAYAQNTVKIIKKRNELIVDIINEK